MAAIVGPPPPGVTLGTTLAGPLDWIQAFVAGSAELAAIVPPLTVRRSPG